MKNFYFFLTLLGVVFNFNSCDSASCTDLPTNFTSYQKAVSEIKSANFTIEDNLDTSRSSIIRNAFFYSCNSKTGFLLVKIKSTEYIYQNVPISVWENFKEAGSFGRFYNNNIKGNYTLKIN